MSLLQGGLLRAAKWLGLFHLARWLTADRLRILCYHGAWEMEDGFAGDSMFMRPETFESRLDTLQRLNYQVMPLREAVEALRGERSLPAAAVALTIDDGWHSTWTAMAPALAQRNMPATLYCDTGHLMSGEPVAHVIALHFWRLAKPAQKTPATRAIYTRATDRKATLEERLRATRELTVALGVDLQPYIDRRVFHYMDPLQLGDAARRGIDVQLHTHNHSMHDLSAGAILREVTANREILSKLTGKPYDSFKHFCYPSGVCSPAAAESLSAIGIESATTLTCGLASEKSNLLLLPRIVDGDQLSPLRFEAELSGLMHILRVLTGKTQRTPARVPRRRRYLRAGQAALSKQA
jgi:peptidoglycan/xylan/chitin deacetylase (PgdA/CDA1 family)